MIGIYQIVNPKGKIYIGQSINIELRLHNYKNLIGCKNQIKLYNSLRKYGIENHSFNIIEECNLEKLNERERYWQDYFNVLKQGLNLKLTGFEDKKTSISSETKNKIKLGLKTYFTQLSKDDKNKIYGKSSLKRKGMIGNRKKCKLSDEHRKKIKESLKGRKVSNLTKQKIKQSMVGRSITWGDKISKKLKGKPNLKNKGNGNKSVIQFDKKNNQIKEWNSISEASKETKISFNAISNNLVGRTKSSGGFVWKYKN
jgi:group I intron endonuclease